MKAQIQAVAGKIKFLFFFRSFVLTMRTKRVHLCIVIAIIRLAGPNVEPIKKKLLIADPRFVEPPF